jgi:6-phosphogluconolactonase
MGADGHTASLFPYTAALTVDDRVAVANPVEKLNATRITLTVPVFNSSRNIRFLVTGADKAEALKAVLEGPQDIQKLPSQLIHPKDGNLLWIVDEDAARLLEAV